MVDTVTLQHVNIVLSILVLTGIFYLRDVELEGEPFRWYSLFLGLSAILIVAEAGIREFLAGPTHVVHAAAVILLVVALYDPLDNRIRTEEWLDLMLLSANATRGSVTTGDQRILEVLASAGILLTPELISRNIGGVDEEVSERLERLAAKDLVVRANSRKFRITPLGERLVGNGNASDP